jgi:succinate dehydrogenase / fumarate reductase cytochrome b subunit
VQPWGPRIDFMSGAVRYLFSSVGAKTVVALTGLGLTAFVIVHLLGNLQVFLPPEFINKYSEFLQNSVELVWPARIGLLAIFLVHVIWALRLRALNAAARPQPYVMRQTIQASPGSRTMLISGLVLFAFIAFHIAHFTLGWVDAQNFKANLPQETIEKAIKIEDSSGRILYEHPAVTRPDVYAMMVKSFRNPVISGLYILAMIFLGLHLTHGVPSMFQSLGLNGPGWRDVIRKGGIGLALLIVLGNISIPLTILLRLVGTEVR